MSYYLEYGVYAIYAGVSGFPNDDYTSWLGCRYSLTEARSYALAKLANPYTWVRVQRQDEGRVEFEVMVKHGGRAH